MSQTIKLSQAKDRFQVDILYAATERWLVLFEKKKKRPRQVFNSAHNM